MRRTLLVVVMLVVGVAGTTSAPSAAVTSDPWVWSQTGITGGGFQTAIAANPTSPSNFMVGGELSGFHKTTDSGANWVTSNKGVNVLAGTHVASIAYSKISPGTIYAAAGPAKGDGAFLASTDGGSTWTVRAKGPAAPQMSSLSPLCGGSDHPRATGNLIALDEAGTTKYIWAGSLNDGIKRSTDGGRTWRTIALNGAYIRTLVRDPVDASILYAGVCSANGFSGAYKITQARSSTPIVTRLAGAPMTVEEFVFVGTTMYAVANTSGVYRVTNAGTTWTRLGSSFFSTTSKWGTIDGALGPTGNHVLYVAGDLPVSHGNGMYRAVAKSTDGGVTWSWVTVNPAGVHVEMAGSTQPWWLAQNVPSNMIGKSFFTPGQLAVDPTNPQVVLVAGRAGVWRSTDGGANWYPAVRGLQAALTNSIAAKNANLRVGVGDWTQFSSKDHGATVKRWAPNGAILFGYAVELSPNGTTYVGAGQRDLNTGGEVYSNGDPFVASWSDLNLPAGKRIAGLETGKDAAGTEVVLAAVEGAGLWRKVVGGGWVQVATQTAVPVNGTRVSLSWPTPSAPYVYLAVPGQGLYRSSDRGQTWMKVWNGSTLDVAGDPSSSTGQRIYVQRPTAVYRIEDARTGTVENGVLKPVNTWVPQPGPVAVGPVGGVYVAGTGNPPALYGSLNRGASWSNHADAYYQRAAIFPVDIAISGDNHFYVGLKRNGVVVGRP